MEYKAPHRDAGASFARCSSILYDVLPLNRSLTLMITDLLVDLVLTKDLQSSGSLLFKGSILDWGASRLGAYIPSCSSHGQEADHIPWP